MNKTLAIVSTLGVLASGMAGEPTGSEKAKAVFEALKQMEGTWEGVSQSGMKERLQTKLIAAGSVLMETSSLEMATMYHLDGDRVLLTHYCMAKNQPRLQATEISRNGTQIIFTFLDGTNLSSRNRGHMDKVVIRFVDKDTYRSKWTWYENGKERWLEDFTYRRVKS